MIFLNLICSGACLAACYLQLDTGSPAIGLAYMGFGLGYLGLAIFYGSV